MFNRSSPAPRTLCTACLLVLIVNFATLTNAVSQAVQNNNGLIRPERMPVNYWLIKSLGMRTLACLCANRYPIGLDAGEDADFTFRIIRNDNNEEGEIHSLCLAKTKKHGPHILGHIALPLTKGGELKITTPGDDRHNPSSAILREKLKGASLITFKKQGYRLSTCPTDPELYRKLNWTDPQRWPAM